MVTVVQRPQGHKLIDQAISASVIDSSGDALIVFPYHSLSAGAYVYITSDIDEYNGFFYVTVIDSGSFKISENASSDFIEFYQEIDIEYYQTQEHDWSSIFLPIVYKLTNNRWPVNTIDTSRTVSSSSDDNGFTQLTLSGPLRVSFNALEFVQISGNENINGVWQIVEVISTSDIVISLPYDSGNSFFGVTVQYYYNNFQVNIKVFAGLPASHPWEAKKPFEEMAELSLTPDENNEVMFSVSDYIKSKVAIKNNLTLFSLPLNLDAFTGFYISTGESYDYSDGYSLLSTETSYEDDTFEGYAIAGKLPFKNLYSGDYAEYVYTSGSPAKWLTNMDPVAVEDLYFDISFIKNVVGTFNLIINKYVTDYLTQTIVIPYADQGIGVYRLPITADANYDSFCIQVRTDSYSETVEVDPEPIDLSEFQNTTIDPGPLCYVDWDITDVLSIDNLIEDCQTQFAFIAKAVTNGSTLRVNYNITMSYTNMSPPPQNLTIYFALGNTPGATTDLTALTYVVSIIGSATVNLTGFVTILATGDRAYLSIAVDIGNIEELDIEISPLSYGEPTTEEVVVDAETITEEICITMQAQCDITDGVTQEGRRLLEYGDYRLLE